MTARTMRGRLDTMETKAIDIVIPVYNEERDLVPSVRRLHAYLEARFPFPATITIVDNASTDATWPIAEYLASELPNVRAIHLGAKGRGRGAPARPSRGGPGLVLRHGAPRPRGARGDAHQRSPRRLDRRSGFAGRSRADRDGRSPRNPSDALRRRRPGALAAGTHVREHRHREHHCLCDRLRAPSRLCFACHL